MWKSGTFDLNDINEALLKEIVFFTIYFPVMGSWGCVIFLTQSGDEYIVSEDGTNWDVDDIVKFFPDIYQAWVNERNSLKDEYGYSVSKNWKIIPQFAGQFLVRIDYFEKFYETYKTVSPSDKDFPYSVARVLLGRENGVPDERMVYIKNYECWEKRQQEEAKRY